MLLKWTSKLFFKNLTKAISFAISLIVVFTLFSSPSIAAKTSMTGDYTKDTISVVKTLQTAVDTPKDSPNKDEVRSEALTLITDYISRYRNRGLVNKTQSFTKRGLHKAIRFSIATYILMLSVFPQWILLHNHTIPFLSLIGIFGLLHGLRSCKIQHVSFAMVLGLALMISIVHSQVTIPKFAKDLSTKQARDLAFQKIISERYSGKDNQPTIFFVLGTQDAKNILSEPFAFKEKCDACIFTDDRILGHSVLSTTLESTNSTYNLSCDSENFYVITDWHDERITRLLNSRYSYDIVHKEDGLILYHLKPQKAP